MKRSNIILIAAISSISLFICTGALYSVANGKKEMVDNSIELSAPSHKNLVLDHVNYIVFITSGEEYKFKFSFRKGEEKVDVPYLIKGDSLIIKSLPKEKGEGVLNLQLTVPSDQLQCDVIDSDLQIKNFNGQKLKLDLDHSNVQVFTENEEKVNIELNSKNGSDFRSSVNFDEVIIKVEDSKFMSWGSNDNIVAEVSNNSNVGIKHPGKMSTNKDESSSVTFYYH